MDLSQVALNQGLTFLAYATGVVLIVVGGFLVKLLIDLSKLSKNLNETTTILNTELKPTLEGVNQTLKIINDLVKSTDQGVDNVKLAVEKFIGKTKAVSETILGGILKGFVSVMGFLSKNSR